MVLIKLGLALAGVVLRGKMVSNKSKDANVIVSFRSDWNWDMCDPSFHLPVAGFAPEG
jgi:hypothetical protein